MLGFGVMRLPRLEEDRTRIDEVEATRMLRHAIDHGVNFLDLGYLYDSGQREQVSRLIGQILQNGYRQKIKIAASLPVSLINSTDDVESYLNQQLDWLQIDKLDFFLLAELNRQNWPDLPSEEIFKHTEAAIAEGRLDWLGFSFHDDYQTLRSVLEAYDNWSLCRFQYSFMDVDHHPGVGGIKYAYDKGLAVVITKPLKGGRLTRKFPESVKKIWAESTPKRSPAEWGLCWVWNHPEIATAVSDMSSLAQVKENVALADKAQASSLTVPEELVINRVRDTYREMKPIPCTACRGCMPCPKDIDVPRIFELYNDAVIYNDIETVRSVFRNEKHRIDTCDACGDCIKSCGFKLPVIDWLKKARTLLAGDE